MMMVHPIVGTGGHTVSLELGRRIEARFSNQNGAE
jgi:hypothetical protein